MLDMIFVVVSLTSSTHTDRQARTPRLYVIMNVVIGTDEKNKNNNKVLLKKYAVTM